MKIRLCKLAKKHHDESCRQFAHVFHKRDTICVTPEFYNLPQGYMLGILLHEMGHLALSDQPHHTEDDADRIGFILSEVHIFRRTYRNMSRLQYVKASEKNEALNFLKEHITDWYR